MDIPVVKRELLAAAEQKFKESGERLSALSDWLYENTATATGGEYDSKVAAYHTELRRYDMLDAEIKQLIGGQKPAEKQIEQNMRSNNEKKFKVNY